MKKRVTVGEPKRSLDWRRGFGAAWLAAFLSLVLIIALVVWAMIALE